MCIILIKRYVYNCMDRTYIKRNQKMLKRFLMVEGINVIYSRTLRETRCMTILLLEKLSIKIILSIAVIILAATFYVVYINGMKKI